MLLSLLRLISVATLLPLPSDTPPAQRIPAPQPRELRAADDVVLTARMADGSRAPSSLVLPQLGNRREVFAYLLANYPDTMQAGHAEVMPVAWVYIDEAGATHFPELIVTSGKPAFDSLALAMVTRARFAPARVQDTVVPVWVMLPVQLTRRAASTPGPQDPSRPYFTPYTKKPELANRADVARALVQNYPPDLRAQGVGGTVQVWLFVNQDGVVERAQVKQTSNAPQLDDAALRVARMMLFSPAENRGQKTAVWIAVPIVFATR